MQIIIDGELVADDAYLNATTYVTQEEIVNIPSIFHLVVKDGEEIIEDIERALCLSKYEVEGEGYLICFGEQNEEEYRYNKQQSQIEYIAMMSDIDLEEGV